MTGLIVPGPALSSEVNDAINTYTLNAQSGSTYTLAELDEGKCVTFSAACAVTVPPNSSVPIIVGAWVDLLNIGTGLLTIGPGSGVTVNGCTVAPPGSRVRAIKQATNVWYAQVMPAAPGGMLLATAAPSAAATLSFDNVFSTAFGRYRVEYDLVHSASGVGLQVRMRVATVDDSSANYADQYVQGSGGGAAGAQQTGQTSMRVGFVNAAGSWGHFDLWAPASAVATRSLGTNGIVLTGPSVQVHAAAHNVATAYDGLTIFPTSGTITGTLRVYAIPTAL